MAQKTMTITEFAQRLKTSRRQISRLAEIADTGFMYRHTSLSPLPMPSNRRRRLYAEWQAEAIENYVAGTITIRQAKRIYARKEKATLQSA